MSATLEDARLGEGFWRRVETTPDCWLWTGARDRQGYGKFYLHPGSRLAHRVAFEALVGQIPEGLQLDHLRRNTGCVRPDHLEPVTQLENMRRRYTNVTHCVNGHEFTEANTYWRPNGHRDCRACVRRRAASYKERKAA